MHTSIGKGQSTRPDSFLHMYESVLPTGWKAEHVQKVYRDPISFTVIREQYGSHYARFWKQGSWCAKTFLDNPYEQPSFLCYHTQEVTLIEKAIACKQSIQNVRKQVKSGATLQRQQTQMFQILEQQHHLPLRSFLEAYDDEHIKEIQKEQRKRKREEEKQDQKEGIQPKNKNITKRNKMEKQSKQEEEKQDQNARTKRSKAQKMDNVKQMWERIQKVRYRLMVYFFGVVGTFPYSDCFFC